MTLPVGARSHFDIVGVELVKLLVGRAKSRGRIESGRQIAERTHWPQTVGSASELA